MQFVPAVKVLTAHRPKGRLIIREAGGVSHARSVPTEAELTALCRRHLAPFKTPRHWLFLEEIPRTISGKVEREELRKLLSAATT
jgi:acyl-coenzyme A synthetase/AMP-(fatty) acid ligase